MDTSQLEQPLQPQLRQQLILRVKDIFEAYAAGSDVAPAQRYRTEGFAEALIAEGRITKAEFGSLIAQSYQQVYGREMPEKLKQEGSIPSLMKRAPVYPSTKS